MIRRPLFKAASSLAAILILAAGCADHSPTAVQLEATASLASHGVAKVVRFDHEAGTYSAMIGRHGGTLDFGIGSIEFPAGSLRNTVRITATTDGATLGAKMGPSGLSFPGGAKLCFDADPANVPAGSKILVEKDDGRIEEVAGEWEGGRFCGTVDHFCVMVVGHPG